MKDVKFFKKTDIIVLGVILLLGVVSVLIYKAFQANRPVKAEIYYRTELIKTVNLNTGEDLRFSIPQNEHVIFHLYPDGKICFEESDCPDKTCVRTGKLYMAGQTAVCLPNEIILKIVGIQRGTDDPDIIIN